MNIEPIAFFRSPFRSKFGIPRQSGLVSELRGRIEMVETYRTADSLQGLDGFDYLWAIWGFSAHESAAKHPTVRPPLLGGNERMGVWATRSPFRPNNLGLSSLRIDSVDAETGVINVLGADLMDGTPIFDIKPYLPYVDSHPESRAGFTDNRQWHRLQVEMPAEAVTLLGEAEAEVLRQSLALDPRPHYHDDDGRVYGMPFGEWDIRFRVAGDVVHVESMEKK